MEVRFRRKQLEKCYTCQGAAIRRWGAAVARKYVQRVNDLYAVNTIDDLFRIPPLRFHALTGPRRGQYALSLSERMRLIVTFTGKGSVTAWVEEVSKHYDD